MFKGKEIIRNVVTDRASTGSPKRNSKTSLIKILQHYNQANTAREGIRALSGHTKGFVRQRGATAIIYNLTLITRNTSDFKNMDGIKVVNPFEIKAKSIKICKVKTYR